MIPWEPKKLKFWQIYKPFGWSLCKIGDIYDSSKKYIGRGMVIVWLRMSWINEDDFGWHTYPANIMKSNDFCAVNDVTFLTISSIFPRQSQDINIWVFLF